MRGDLPRREAGQLALLDAMVFFSIAMLVSSILVSYVQESSDDSHSGAERPPVDAKEVLGVLLAASISQQMKVDFGAGLILSGRESVAECLSAELYALSLGIDVSLFSELNEGVMEVMDSLVGQVFHGRLTVVRPGGHSGEPLLALPGPGGYCRLAFAACVELPCSDGLLYTVILALEPAAPSEFVQV